MSGRTMENISYSALRRNLAQSIDRVNEDHAPLLVTRRSGSPAVLMSLEDFQAYEETAYLMASPENARRLNRAVADVEAGRTESHDLIEP